MYSGLPILKSEVRARFMIYFFQLSKGESNLNCLYIKTK